MYESEFFEGGGVAKIMQQDRMLNMCIFTAVSQVHVNSQIADTAFWFDGK